MMLLKVKSVENVRGGQCERWKIDQSRKSSMCESIRSEFISGEFDDVSCNLERSELENRS